VRQVRGSDSSGLVGAQVDTKKAGAPPLNPKKTTNKTTMMMDLGGSGGGRSGAAQADAKKAATPQPDLKVVAEKTTTESGGSGGGGSRAAQMDAKKAVMTPPNKKATATPDPKMVRKRPAPTMGSGGSIPHRKQFCSPWTYQGYNTLCYGYANHLH
jgi:hypothetical protein